MPNNRKPSGKTRFNRFMSGAGKSAMVSAIQKKNAKIAGKATPPKTPTYQNALKPSKPQRPLQKPSSLVRPSPYQTPPIKARMK